MELVHSRFPALLSATVNQYHAYISYRHGNKDLAEVVRGYLNTQILDGQKVEVFLDNFDNGQSVEYAMMQGMLHSLVVVPLITPETLERMKHIDSLKDVDYVMLEWMLAMMLLDLPGYPVMRICPILSGTVFSFISLLKRLTIHTIRFL
jgi:long-subunit acyl-CoA synthetase (AMP-forming)